jgi:pSer/pThr/pTyr-binding forkhead associated (FHA) protein
VIYGAPVAPVAAAPVAAEPRVRPHTAVLLIDGRRLLIGPAGATIGRSRQCDIVLEDPNVSRRHAEVRPGEAGSWVLADLGSTNGSSLNGRRIDHPAGLHPGDEIEVGTSVITFEVE